MVAKSVPLPSGPVSLRSPRSPTGSESDAELETEGLGLRGEVNIGGGVAEGGIDKTPRPLGDRDTTRKFQALSGISARFQPLAQLRSQDLTFALKVITQISMYHLFHRTFDMRDDMTHTTSSPAWHVR